MNKRRFIVCLAVLGVLGSVGWGALADHGGYHEPTVNGGRPDRRVTIWVPKGNSTEVATDDDGEKHWIGVLPDEGIMLNNMTAFTDLTVQTTRFPEYTTKVCNHDDETIRIVFYDADTGDTISTVILEEGDCDTCVGVDPCSVSATDV